MRLIAAVHADPLATWLPALVIVALAAWHAAILARTGTPRARRWIRGSALVTVLAVVACVVAGTSHVDRATHPRRYLLVWTAAVGGLVVLVLIALADFVTSMILIGRTIDAERETATPSDA